MRKRFVLSAAVCILAFPLAFSPSHNNDQLNSVASTTVAFAGHTHPGFGWCEADPCPFSNLTMRQDSKDKRALQTDSPNDFHQAGDVDSGAGLLLLAIAFFVGLRARA